MNSKRHRNIIRIGVLIFFILVLSKIIDLKLLKEALQNVRFEIIFFAIFLSFCNIGIRAYRWKEIFNKDERRLSLKDAYIMTLIGVALNMFVPATFGDILKSYYGYRMYGRKEEMLSASVVDKMFALCALFLLGSISGYLMGYYILSVGALFCATLISVPLAFPKVFPWNLANTVLRVFKKSLDTEKLLTAFTLPALLKLIVMGLSIGGWFSNSVFFYVLCSAFSARVSLGYVVLIMPMLVIVRLFPFTVNALGPKEVAVVFFSG